MSQKKNPQFDKKIEGKAAVAPEFRHSPAPLTKCSTKWQSQPLVSRPVRQSFDLQSTNQTDENKKAQKKLENILEKVKSNRKKKFQCPECSVGIKGLYTFKVHLQRHYNLLPFKCSFCSKTFPSVFHKKVHERVHKGSKPQLLKCKFCSKKFTQKLNLDRHTSWHHLRVKPKPIFNAKKTQLTVNKESKGSTVSYKNHRVNAKVFFECEKCGATLSSRSNLKRHVDQIHLVLRPFKCSYCERAFLHACNLKKHLKVVHSNISGEGEHFRDEEEIRNEVTNSMKRMEKIQSSLTTDLYLSSDSDIN